MDEPTGIPGHSSHKGPERMLQEELARMGVSFEAEGETTRIHLGEVIVEVKDDPDFGRITQIQIPLPTPGDDPLESLKSFEIFSRIVSGLKGEIRYIVEELAPGYPQLLGIIPYQDALEQVEDLLKIIRDLQTSNK